ncbi:MAG: DNA-3-methyladenine glycosylase 2 family protein [Clostridia bacterium]|nr:DNA-3-methyladenine glycosylase 2 family protein [Clostridia bacterium]
MKELKIEVNYFNLKYTLECGQCFRWTREDEYYIGIIKDRVIKIRQQDNYLYIISNEEEKLEESVKEYFELSKDYESIEKRISKVDEYVKKAVSNTSGLRHLKQDLFETIISYIISANNNIPRISKSVNEISKRYGKKIIFNEKEYYLFPTPEELKDVTIEEYRECGIGFRDKYIFNTVKEINEGKFNLSELKDLSTELLREKLLSLMGIGPKVADCILLFSCGRQEVFPVDVWVERVMKKFYFKEANVSKKEILKYSIENFGSDAGIIQQHLFYNIRENLI